MIQSSPVKNTEIFNMNFIKNRKLYENCPTEILHKIKTIKTVLKTDRASTLKELKDILCSYESLCLFPKLSNIYITLYYDIENNNIIHYFQFDKKGDDFGPNIEPILRLKNKTIKVLEDTIKLSSKNAITNFLLNKIDECEFKKEYIDEIIKLLILKLTKIKKITLEYSDQLSDKQFSFFIQNLIYLDEQTILDQLSNQTALIKLFKNAVGSFYKQLDLLKKHSTNTELLNKIDFVEFIKFVKNNNELSDSSLLELLKLNISYDMFENFLSFIIEYEDDYQNYRFLNHMDIEMIEALFNKFETLGAFNKKYLKLNENNEFFYDCPNINLNIKNNLEVILNNFRRHKLFLSVFFKTDIVQVCDNDYQLFNYRKLLFAENSVLEISGKHCVNYNFFIKNLSTLINYSDRIFIYINNQRLQDNFIDDKLFDIDFLEFYNKDKINLHKILSNVVILDNNKPLQDHFENKILINY